MNRRLGTIGFLNIWSWTLVIPCWYESSLNSKIMTTFFSCSLKKQFLASFLLWFLRKLQIFVFPFAYCVNFHRKVSVDWLIDWLIDFSVYFHRKASVDWLIDFSVYFTGKLQLIDWLRCVFFRGWRKERGCEWRAIKRQSAALSEDASSPPWTSARILPREPTWATSCRAASPLFNTLNSLPIFEAKNAEHFLFNNTIYFKQMENIWKEKKWDCTDGKEKSQTGEGEKFTRTHLG